MSEVRILTLTSSTGGGHDARAAAFERWVRKLYGGDVEVRVENMLEDSSTLARLGVNLYNWIQKNAPSLQHPYHLIVEGLSILNRSKVVLGRRYYEGVISSFRPHLVFSVHDCLNRGYFQVARNLLGSSSTRCATYCSEFSGGYGYSRNWVEPSVDLYISRTPAAQNFAISHLGLDPAKAKIRGHLLDPQVYETPLSAPERYRFITERLTLRPDRKIVFLATGGVGANNHLELLPALKKFSETYQALLVCGRNRQIYLKALDWAKMNPELTCHVEGYCQEMHLFMQVSDFIVSRGGTTTCTEALHFGCPIIFNGIGGVMPQERLTVKYFMEERAAEKIESGKDFEKLLIDWSQYPEKLRLLKERFNSLKFSDSPSQAVVDLVALARSAALREIASNDGGIDRGSD